MGAEKPLRHIARRAVYERVRYQSFPEQKKPFVLSPMKKIALGGDAGHELAPTLWREQWQPEDGGRESIIILMRRKISRRRSG